MPGQGLHRSVRPGGGGLARVDPDGSARVVAKGMLLPNGEVLSPVNGRTLIVAEKRWAEAICLHRRVHEREPDGRLASLGPGVPAESPDRDKAARYPPDREDQQRAAREPAVQGADEISSAWLNGPSR